MTITLDGYDASINYTIQYINVWKNWAQREMGTVATLPHGTQVELLEHKGRRVKIRHGEVEGFVTDYFVREFKGGA